MKHINESIIGKKGSSHNIDYILYPNGPENFPQYRKLEEQHRLTYPHIIDNLKFRAYALSREELERYPLKDKDDCVLYKVVDRTITYEKLSSDLNQESVPPYLKCVWYREEFR